MEIWKPVVGFEGRYEVSNFGNVKSKNFGKQKLGERIMKPTLMKVGYLAVNLSAGGKNDLRYIHRLVLEAFVGGYLPGTQTRHLDGNKTNNRLDNLAIGTQSENELDKVLHGRSNQGERHWNSKLTESQVQSIREKRKSGQFSIRKLSKMFGVGYNAIEKILKGKRWKHVRV